MATEKEIQAMLAEIAKLKAEKEALLMTKVKALSCKLGENGHIIVSGLGRFPTTLRVGQWQTLLAGKEMIETFIKDNSIKANQLTEAYDKLTPEEKEEVKTAKATAYAAKQAAAKAA